MNTCCRLSGTGRGAGAIASAKSRNRSCRLKRRIDQELERLPKVTTPSGPPDQIYITGRLNRLLAQAEDEAKRLKDDYVSVEHVLLAMTDDGGATGRLAQGTGDHPRAADAGAAGGAR